jgi:3-(3-hydroxy-phenyl)propionate hydroxylase
MSNADPTLPLTVVGGGPVGLCVALCLARHGCRVTVYEADPTFCEGSRAICISRRSLQILARLGVADPFLEEGLPWSEGRSYLGTSEVFHLRLDSSPHDRFPPFINLQQHRAEQFLAEACLATGRVAIEWETRVTELSQHSGGVRLGLERRGRSAVAAAGWVVAADGGRSTVRDLLGLSLEGQSYQHRYLIADIALDADWPVERKVWFDPASNPHSTVIMHKQPGGVWRIDYQLLPDENEEQALEEAAIARRISAHLALVGLPPTWRLLWKTLYKARALTLADYVHDHVLFAGDAAHLVPIFGVRGLNSGFDDAINLGWKLALVATRRARPDLLDSYSAERRGACAENLAEATKSTRFMSPLTPGFATARDAVLEIATRNRAFRGLVDPRQASGHVYALGAILSDGAHRLIGAPLPEARDASGRSIHDLVGTGFSALHFSGSRRSRSIDLCMAGIPVRCVLLGGDGPVAERLDVCPGDLFLVRPDGHVAAVVRSVEESDAEAVIQSLLSSIASAPIAQELANAV